MNKQTCSCYGTNKEWGHKHCPIHRYTKDSEICNHEKLSIDDMNEQGMRRCKDCGKYIKHSKLDYHLIPSPLALGIPLAFGWEERFDEWRNDGEHCSLDDDALNSFDVEMLKSFFRGELQRLGEMPNK